MVASVRACGHCALLKRRFQRHWAGLVFTGGRNETGAPQFIREMAEFGLLAPKVRFMGPCAIAVTTRFDGNNGKWSFDRNGDAAYEAGEINRTISRYRVVGSERPLGCEFFDSGLVR